LDVRRELNNKKAPLGAFLLRCGDHFVSSARWYARRLNPAHLPGYQHADKEHNRQSYAQSECRGHVALSRRRTFWSRSSIAHHVNQGRSQTCQNGDECNSNQYFHEAHYPMSDRPLFWQRVLVLIVALLGIGITASLGLWQLGRGAQKLALQDARRQQAALSALDGKSLGDAVDSVANREGLIYRKFHLKGHWLQEYTVYLDNRQMQGRPGFFVMTPLQITETSAVILVQRGWAPRSFTDRAELPSIETPNTEVTIEGYLAPWPSRLYDFGGDERGLIRQNLDLRSYRQQTTLPLLEVSLLQEGPASEGLMRDWPLPASGAEKHQGYALQWFGLSALIALLYVWFQIVQPRRKHGAV